MLPECFICLVLTPREGGGGCAGVLLSRSAPTFSPPRLNMTSAFGRRALSPGSNQREISRLPRYSRRLFPARLRRKQVCRAAEPPQDCCECLRVCSKKAQQLTNKHIPACVSVCPESRPDNLIKESRLTGRPLEIMRGALHLWIRIKKVGAVVLFCQLTPGVPLKVLHLLGNTHFLLSWAGDLPSLSGRCHWCCNAH